MVSVRRILKVSQTAKIDASRRRRQTERKLKESLSLSRRSTSGLGSLQRRLESFHENTDEITNLLNQRLAQRDSVGRLKTADEERLNQEKDAKTSAEQELEFADSAEEKASARSRLDVIIERISELQAEIRQRALAEKKLAKPIEELSTRKARLMKQTRKSSQNKPDLLDLVKSSRRSSVQLRDQVGRIIKQEQNAARRLVQVTEKLKELQRKKRRTAKKKKKTSRRKLKRKKSKIRVKVKHKKVKRKSKRAKKKISKKRRTKAKSRRRSR